MQALEAELVHYVATTHATIAEMLLSCWIEELPLLELWLKIGSRRRRGRGGRNAYTCHPVFVKFKYAIIVDAGSNREAVHNLYREHELKNDNLMGDRQFYL